MDQQAQAKAYFDAFAEDWQNKSEGKTDGYNVIAARNHAVMQVVNRKQARAFLDVGCGSGQLAIQVAKKGFLSIGMDFAPEMIRQAKHNEAMAGLKLRWLTQSFFEKNDLIPHTFDVVSALGFIEYISSEQLDQFFRDSVQLLERWRVGGSIVVGSRNRLFNLVTENEYTEAEQKLGTIDALKQESAIIESASTQEEVLTKLAALHAKLPHPNQHARTGIGVDTRYQYSTAELIERARQFKLKPVTIFPCNYHAMSIADTKANPAKHAKLAMEMESKDYPNHKLLPRCSTYVLELQLAI